MTSYACYACGSTYQERFGCCTSCLETGTIVPLPEREKVRFERPNRQGCKNLLDLRSFQDSGNFIQGFEELGKLSSGFKILLTGLPGSGKSTLALLIANNFKGRVFYGSVEESFAESFIKKLRTWEITNTGIVFSDCKSINELRHDLLGREIDLVVVDSVSVLGEIPDIGQNYSQIWVCHATKTGNYKGDSELGHLVDIIIQCENGIGHVQKNRFAPLTDINIFGSCKDEKNDMPFMS